MDKFPTCIHYEQLTKTKPNTTKSYAYSTEYTMCWNKFAMYAIITLGYDTFWRDDMQSVMSAPCTHMGHAIVMGVFCEYFREKL